MVIAPVLPFMVKSFFQDLPAERMGYYVGVLTSVLYLGQLISSPFWGWLSDHIGRRPTLLLGMLGHVISLTMLAFSPQFIWALVARFGMGLLNGNTPVCKAYVAGICTPSQVAFAMGLLSLQWSLGSILGPIVGGLLANPTSKYAALSECELLHQYPFVLSLGVPIVCTLGVLILTFALLPEPSGEDLSASISDSQNPSASSPMLLKPKSDWEILLGRAVVVSIFLYTVICSCTSAFNTIFPVYLASPMDAGGAGLGSSEVGLLLGSGGYLQILWQPLIFPMLTKVFGFRICCRVGFFIYGLLVFCAPYTSQLQRDRDLRWWVTIMLCICINACTATAFSTNAVMVNFASPPHLRGRVNGIAQTAAAAARVVAPVGASLLFAWTMSNRPSWPFDFHFTFQLLGCLGLVAAAVTLLLPASLERPHSRAIEAKLSMNSDNY
jgi:MFS family permease